jgi:hypothetical protein
MNALTLPQRLALRAIASSDNLMGKPAPGPSSPANLLGRDKATGNLIVSRNGVRVMVRSSQSKGVGNGRSVAIYSELG